MSTDKASLQGFVQAHPKPGTKVFTDDHAAYDGMSDVEHETVNHSAGEHVFGIVHTNGIEWFWATLKRAHKGEFHHVSPKHLQRYVTEFAGRHNIRPLDTEAQMRAMVRGMKNKFLRCKDLIA